MHSVAGEPPPPRRHGGHLSPYPPRLRPPPWPAVRTEPQHPPRSLLPSGNPSPQSCPTQPAQLAPETPVGPELPILATVTQETAVTKAPGPGSAEQRLCLRDQERFQLDLLQLALCSGLSLLVTQLAFTRSGTSTAWKKQRFSDLHQVSGFRGPRGRSPADSMPGSVTQPRGRPSSGHAGIQQVRTPHTAARGGSRGNPHRIQSSLCTERVSSQFSKLLREGLLHII